MPVASTVLLNRLLARGKFRHAQVLLHLAELGSVQRAADAMGMTQSSVTQSLAYHRDAFTFATADLKLPQNQQMASRKVQDGISLRIWQGTDIVNDEWPTRSDVLWGCVTTYPQLAARVWG